jgi:hypothetical protein
LLLSLVVVVGGSLAFNTDAGITITAIVTAVIGLECTLRRCHDKIQQQTTNNKQQQQQQQRKKEQELVINQPHSHEKCIENPNKSQPTNAHGSRPSSIIMDLGWSLD